MKQIVSTVLEVCGAAAVVAGIYIAFGAGVALIIGGATAVLFGVALDGPIRKNRL